jgi:hypothetical protein
MTALIENRIEKAVADPSTFTVRLMWKNGHETFARFGHLVKSGVFEPLSHPDVFNQVRVEREGRALTWPGDIEFCADALWYEANPGDVPENLAPYFPAPKIKRGQSSRV